LSWHIVATPHSFVHGHINFVLWYMPFMFFAAATAFVVIGAYLLRVPNLTRQAPAEVIWLGTLATAVILAAVVFPADSQSTPAAFMTRTIADAELLYQQRNPALEVRGSDDRIYFIGDCDSAALSVQFFVHVYKPGVSDFQGRDFSWDAMKIP